MADVEQETQPKCVPVTQSGYELIRDPLLNKGTAFTRQERDELGLHGLLPSEVNTMDQQEQRAYAGISDLAAPLDRYVRLSDLQDRNEYLFHRVLSRHIEALMPVVYTPTVALATQNFSRVFRRGRGVWITPDLRGRIDQALRNGAAGRRIRLIVVTDNESILGIGDQGAGGMAVSIGKLALYTTGAGIAPEYTLPVSLDVGTNNSALLGDPLYLGWRHERLCGSEYDALVDEFVGAVKQVFPGALVQWEDFRKDNALAILERHRTRLMSFNDDIQGTGAVALSGILAALRLLGGSLMDQRVLVHGAGAAGLGISRQLRSALVAAGLSRREALVRVGVLDRRGLLVDDRDFGDPYKRDLAWPAEVAHHLGLADPSARDLRRSVSAFHPTVLIGASGQAGAFDEPVIRAMAGLVAHPIVLPFSNPTMHSEATPADVLKWTGGRALVATGSPFPPVDLGGHTIEVGQGNNVFIFPGLGLGALEAQVAQVTDGMVSAAATALADKVDEAELARGSLYPAVTRLREVSREVALAVAAQAQRDGVAGRRVEQVARTIDQAMWSPVYPRYTRR